MNQKTQRLFFCIWLLSRLTYSQGSEGFTEDTSVPFPPVYFSSSAFADVDDDGDQDVLITGFSANDRISNLYLNDGDGTFREDFSATFDGVSHSSVAFADVDSDGDQDVLITGGTGSGPSASSRISKLYLNDGTGSFTPITTPFSGVHLGSVAFADVDGDTDLDVLITGLNNSNIPTSKLYLNDGTGIFTEDTTVPFLGVLYSSVAFADVDGDTDLDVLITGSSGASRTSILYINNGMGAFSEDTTAPFIAVQYGSVAFADVDGDSDQDVVITGQYNNASSTSRLYLNNGTGTYTFKSTGFSSVYNSSIAFSDVDSDGDPDLMINGTITNSTGSRISLNDGSASFPETIQLDETSSGSVSFADVDGDDDPDLIITGSGVSKLYLNSLSTVAQVITINSQPSAIEECEDGNVSFSIDASGTTSLQYRWQENQGSGFSDLSDGGTISGSQASELNISNIQSAMDGFLYRCIISGDNANDAQSDEVSLQILSEVEIIAQPTDNQVIIGKQTTFTVNAIGDDVSFQWQKDSDNISGAVTSSHVISSATKQDEGLYRCVVSNSCNGMVSAEVALQVCDPVVISNQSSGSVTVCEGENHTFGITDQGDAVINYVWYKGNVSIPGAANSFYELTDLGNSDAGEYKVVATNDCGMDSVFFQLDVTLNPAVNAQPVNQTVDEGATVSFSVTATGENLSYQWQKDGDDISGATSSTLSLNSVSLQDAGAYQCTITNDCGAIPSDEVSLTINDPNPLHIGENLLTVYPNPSFGQLHIDGLPEGPNRSIVIMDLSGKKVMQSELSKSENSLDISSLPIGIYWIHIFKGQEKVYSLRVVLNQN